ncbi:MAG: hypothetical protein MJ212_00330 [Alphaproteobacteria bacterium]|nr:hypothetical protein [Alphaproteobacteria bacterium]
MGGFWGWFIVFVGVLAIFNAEKLPAIRKMLEEKFKDSVDAAKESSKVAQAKLKQVKAGIENKKNAPQPQAEAEENSPEEIDEALQFMKGIVKEGKTSNKKDEEKSEKNSDTQEEIIVASEPQEDAPIDLEKRD